MGVHDPMSRFAGMRAVPIEYLTLDIDREGPPVGYLGGRPIPGTVIDTAGQRYRFAGLAPRRPNGEIDIAALNPREWIVRPGLVYFLEG
jgi:hypothetical protein